MSVFDCNCIWQYSRQRPTFSHTLTLADLPRSNLCSDSNDQPSHDTFSISASFKAFRLNSDSFVEFQQVFPFIRSVKKKKTKKKNRRYARATVSSVETTFTFFDYQRVLCVRVFFFRRFSRRYFYFNWSMISR